MYNYILEKVMTAVAIHHRSIGLFEKIWHYASFEGEKRPCESVRKKVEIDVKKTHFLSFYRACGLCALYVWLSERQN